MNMLRATKNNSTISDAFEQLAKESGIVLLHCDSNGSIISPKDADWLTDFLITSPMLRASLRAHCIEWNSTKVLSPVESVAGIWLVPVKSSQNNKQDGFVIGVIITDDFLTSEYLYALCQASNADKTMISQMISDLPPASATDVRRLSSLFQFAWNAHSFGQTNQLSIDLIGQELADSYEEISLLYTMTSRMNSVNHPERFIELACSELLETLPYAWIGVRLNVGSRLPRPGDQFTICGESSREIESLSESVCRATNNFSIDTLLVSKGHDFISNSFGKAAIIEPIVNDGLVLGVLIAGDKQGEDDSASSVDIKLLNATAAQLSIFLANAILYEDLNATFLGTLEALTTSIDAKDRYTCGHSQRVAMLTAQLAEAAGYNEEQIERCRIAGLVHDIGKIGVPENVLLKHGKLSDDEYQKIQKHPEIGAHILRGIPQMEDVLCGVLHHHERYDGTGYPQKLSGDSIPEIARMISIADTFDAMSSSRTYRSAMTREVVINEMKGAVGHQFDPRLSAIFFNLDFSSWENLMVEHQGRSLIAPRSEAI